MKILFALLVSLSPALARAEARDSLKKIDAVMSACLAQDETRNHASMRSCTASALKAADKVLRESYQAEVAKLKKEPDEENLEYLHRLQTAQREWAAFRDANAALHGVTVSDGTGETFEILNAKLEMTKDRVLELDELFNPES